LEAKIKEKLEDFLRGKEIQKELRRRTAAGHKSLVVEFGNLLEFDKDLAKILLDSPTEFFDDADAILEGITKIPGVRLRVKGLPESIEIRHIRAEHVSKFIQVEGIMTRAGEVKPEVKEAVFKCRRCGEENKVFQAGEFFREPLVCENPNCRRKGPFDLVIESTVFRDWQSICVQEPPEKLRGGRMPRRLDGIIRDDFVDKAVPGNHVVLTGVLRVFQERQRGERRTTFRKILFVSHIEVKQKGVEEAELTEEDVKKIEELAKDPWIRNKIIQSILPAIHGHEAVKEAVALQLFGCNPVELPDGTRIRGDTHILLTGDPGVAKSQILKWMANVAPRGLYTSGMKATGAGLTAAAVRDEISGGWALEAGALVIADGGLAAIDEFEKMSSEDAAAILESMEQQSYHPNVEILLSDGRKVRIGEFVDEMMAQHKDKIIPGVDCEILPLDQSIQIFTHGGNGIERVRIDRVSRHVAPKEFVKLTYSNGRSVTVTPEHPVFLWKDNQVTTLPAKEVPLGSFVPAPRTIPNSAEAVSLSAVERGYRTEKDIKTPKTLIPELAGILGFLVSEGWAYKPAYEIGFANSDLVLVKEMKQRMEHTFAITPRTQIRESDGMALQRYNSARMYKWFEENFPEMLVHAPLKRVPSKIMGASREIVREFLQAAFLGDGSVESASICYRTKSRGLAEDYQDLLLKLSINSRIVTDRSNDSYKVYITGDSFQEFSEKLVSQNDPRRKKIEQMVEKSKKVSRHHDVLPAGVARELVGLYRVAGLPYNGYFKEHLDFGYGITRGVVIDCLNKLRRRFQFLREVIKTPPENLKELRKIFGYSQAQVAQLLGLKRGNIDYVERGGYAEEKRKKLLADLVSALSRELDGAIKRMNFVEKLCDFRWFRIKKVEILPNSGSLSTNWVYDVTVEPTHNFISHGLLLHNTISIAKAGIVATLNTRTAVLAAANPRFGRFDKNMPPAQQLSLDPVLLSRFDMVLIMRDEPRPDYDHAIAQHILRMHTEPKKVVKAPFDPDFLRKIIIYARKNIDPKIEDKEVEKAIENFFVDWRKVVAEGAPLPITVRQLEALIRLAKANARMRLSNTVTIEDANRAINLIKTSLKEAGLDTEANVVDIDLLMTGIPKSQRERRQRVLEIIKELEEEYGGAAPVQQVKIKAGAEGIRDSFVEWLIEEEKKRGYLYSPTPETVSRAVK
jgi:replicative DNA helicase Mcm